jgi:hypothetical protein
VTRAATPSKVEQELVLQPEVVDRPRERRRRLLSIHRTSDDVVVDLVERLGVLQRRLYTQKCAAFARGLMRRT